jgi:hypothetical protein
MPSLFWRLGQSHKPRSVKSRTVTELSNFATKSSPDGHDNEPVLIRVPTAAPGALLTPASSPLTG